MKANFWRQEVRALASALAFFSRLPVKVGEFDLCRGVFYVPLVGYALGGVLVALGKTSQGLLGPWLTAALLLALQYYLANYFHFDGLLDTADALAAPVSQERRLKILKAPEVGVLGFLFGFFFLLTEFLLLEVLVQSRLWWGVGIRPAVGRLVMALIGVLSRPAKQEGLGALFLKGAQKRLWLSQVFWIPVFYLFPLAALIVCLFAPIFSTVWHRDFGGLTGDLLGASEELAEWLFTLALVVGLKAGAW